MNREFYFHDVARENNFNHLTLKSYQMATENLKGGGGGEREVQDYFSLLATHLSTSLFLVSSLSSSNRQSVALDGDWDVTQREWLPGGKFEMRPIANKRAQV